MKIILKLVTDILVIMILYILLHEWGHYLYFKKLGRKIKIYFKLNPLCFQAGNPTDYLILNNKQYINVNLAGITLGLLPIIIYSIIEPFYFIMVLPYLMGCFHDIKNIIKTMGLKKWV